MRMARQQGPKVGWAWGNLTIISHLFEWEICRIFGTYHEKPFAIRYDSARFDVCFVYVADTAVFIICMMNNIQCEPMYIRHTKWADVLFTWGTLYKHFNVFNTFLGVSSGIFCSLLPLKEHIISVWFYKVNYSISMWTLPVWHIFHSSLYQL